MNYQVTNVQILPYEDADEKVWDTFVKNHPRARYSFLIGFKKLIENVFHFSSHYFLIKEENEVIGVVPGFEPRGWFSQKKLISLPFASSGGLLLDSNLSEEKKSLITNLLADHIKKILSDRSLESWEIRSDEVLGNDFKDFKKLFLHRYAILLLGKPEDIWDKKLDYQVKKAIGVAQKSGFTVCHEVNANIIENIFYPLYIDSMKRLGSPPFSLNYFLRAFEFLGSSMELFWLESQGKSVAALLGWKCGTSIQITDIVSDKRFWQYRPNDLLHWEFIRWAADQGFLEFDFGPVRYQGQEHFKKKWGCDFFDYSYYYSTSETRAFKKPLDDKNPVIKKISWLWKVAMPKKLSSTIGLPLRKYLTR